MSLLRDWCAELLSRATGNLIPSGHTAKEDEFKYHAFASHGYRNNDVVNSMIAFGYINQGFNSADYIKWMKEHVSEEDWDDVITKMDMVEPYILRYIKDPLQYLINTDYFTIVQWHKMVTEWKEGIK